MDGLLGSFIEVVSIRHAGGTEGTAPRPGHPPILPRGGLPRGQGKNLRTPRGHKDRFRGGGPPAGDPTTGPKPTPGPGGGEVGPANTPAKQTRFVGPRVGVGGNGKMVDTQRTYWRGRFMEEKTPVGDVQVFPKISFRPRAPTKKRNEGGGPLPAKGGVAPPPYGPSCLAT